MRMAEMLTPCGEPASGVFVWNEASGIGDSAPLDPRIERFLGETLRQPIKSRNTPALS